ncbi:MAG: cache domain-containing protein [Anaerolineales bacterium]
MKANTISHRPLRSLTYTLTIAFITLSLVALVADGIFALYTNLARQQEYIATQQQLIARQANEAVGGFFEEKYRSMESTTKIVALSNGTIKDRELILDSLLATQPSFRQMALLDESGMIAAQASNVALELSEQFTSRLQEARASLQNPEERYIGAIYFDKTTNEPLIVLAVPTNLWNFKGTLIAEVNLQFMWTLVEQLKVGETGYVYIVDNKGNLVAAKDSARVLRGENVKQIIEVKEFIGAPSAPTDKTLDINAYAGLTGGRVVGTYLPLGSPQWAVVTELPYEEAYAPVFNTISVSLASILLTGLLAAIVGSIIARRIARPLVELTGTATRISNGEIELRAPETGAQEIVTLASAFNVMTSQLRGLIGNLEGRVASRTAELEIANKQTSRRASQLQGITELSEAIAHLQDLNDIFVTTTHLINERFGFYHVGIFLIDSNREFAILQAANSEGGQRMLARGHRLQLGNRRRRIRGRNRNPTHRSGRGSGCRFL